MFAEFKVCEENRKTKTNELFTNCITKDEGRGEKKKKENRFDSTSSTFLEGSRFPSNSCIVGYCAAHQDRLVKNGLTVSP